MGWGDLWASLGAMGGAAGGMAGSPADSGFRGGVSDMSGQPAMMGQQQMLDAAPAGAMGPMPPQKNLGLPDASNGLTPSADKAGMGHWWRETGGGNVKAAPGGMPGGGMTQALGAVSQFAQRQQQPVVQSMAPRMMAPQMTPGRGGGGGLLSAQPAAAPASGNPYLTASPYARRALQLQRGLL